MCFPKMPVTVYRSACRRVSEDLNFQKYRRDNLNFKLNEAVQCTFRPTDCYTDMRVDSCGRLA
jgi:hypothetical protein